MGRLFGTSGVRGDILTKITPELTLKAGMALATFLGNRGDVVIGSDNRTSSPALKSILAAGLMASGCDVIDVGMVPTPCLAFSPGMLKATSGVAVTASHNPPTDNGWKFYNADGAEYIPEQEDAIEELIFHQNYRTVAWNAVGQPRHAYQVVENYSGRILETIPPVKRELRVVVDCANGVGSLVTPSILSRLGCQVISINANMDPYFPGRPLEPTPESLRGTARLVVDLKADLGIAHDGDADRLAVIDEKGRYVNNDTILAFFAKLLLSRHGPGVIITSVDTSFRIDEAAAKHGGVVERTRLGKTHVPLHKGGRRDIVLCCEPWKIIDPSWGYWGDAIYAACQLVKALDEHGGVISEMLAEIPDYPQERFSVPCPPEVKPSITPKLIELLREEGEAESVWSYDGVRVNYTDGSWLLIRPSGTEDKIRVYCEAHTHARLSQLSRRGRSLVLKALEAA